MLVSLVNILLALTGRLWRSTTAAPGARVREGVCPPPAKRNLYPDRSAVRCGGRSTRRPGSGSRQLGELPGSGSAWCLISALLTVLFATTGTALGATPAGTLITNQANVDYSVGSVVQWPIPSNPATFITRSPSTIEFLQYAPTLPGAESVPVAATEFRDGGGSFNPVTAPPSLASQPVPLAVTSVYHGGDELYLRLTDLDQNLDPTAVETVLVSVTCAATGDVELLRLTETGPDTGVFSGYLPTVTSGAVAADGQLLVAVGSDLLATYSDIVDGTDSSSTGALVDPMGIVFDSRTGEPIDGVSITLTTAGGAPASIFGDDGVSIFPADGRATVVTGGSAVDSSGASYSFPPGGFRFPFVPPGDYRLVIALPPAYSWPSVVPDAVLQTLPGAPFALTVGSRGETFTINPGPALNIDIPLDPDDSGLWLQKRASRETAAIGDFVQYRLTLENNEATVTAPAVTISDRLPLGFRYQRGSTRLDGLAVADPAIAGNGRELTFALGDVAPASRRELSYVLELTAGTPRGDAVNLAQAHDAAAAHSNLARARVRVREELFRSKAFLSGRVLSGACGEGSDLPGLGGIRIFLEDGTYAVTDDQGRYHFEGVEPGVHVVQVDTTSLPHGYEMLPCEQTSRSAGRTFSQFVDLQGGTLWQVDFYAAPIPPPQGEISLQLNSDLDGGQGDYKALLRNGAVPVENLGLTVILPAGAQYLPGTSQLDGQPIADPTDVGGALVYRLPALAADHTAAVTFRSTLDKSQAAGELPAKALLQFDSPASKRQCTPVAETRFRVIEESQVSSQEYELYPRFPSFVAELQPTDLAMLSQLVKELEGQKVVRVDVVGHTDNKRIAPRSRKVFADNQALSRARARSVADFLAAELELPAEAVTVRGLGESLPIADNATAAGRALNRRVDLVIVAEKVTRTTHMELAAPSSPETRVTTVGRSPADDPVTAPAVVAALPVAEPPVIDSAWLNLAKPQTALIWPAADYVPTTPSTSVLVQHRRGEKLELTLNGASVPPLNFSGAKARKDGEVAVSSWDGLDLVDGENRIAVTVTTRDGSTLRQETTIFYSNDPQQAEVVPEQSQLVADGITPPVLAIRITDAAGHPVRPGIYGDFAVEPPYQPLLSSANDSGQLVDPLNNKPRFVTGANGIALLRLAPTSQAGEVTVTLPFVGRQQSVRGWLKPAPRDWILVGLAEGTVGYNTLSGHIEELPAGTDDEGLYESDRLAFFAKGQVKGEWLLTLAYDSDKPNLDGRSLRQTIDPDSYYTLYGDATQQGYEAASARKLFVKLERDQFVALFGDYDTGLTVTELSRYSRSLSGLKVDWQSRRGELRAFASDTGQNFVKDELRGNGTSGLYRLTKKDMVLNSEKVTIEVRDRFHSERVLESRSLTRHLDYEIDYDAATLFFKEPVMTRDAGFNPVWIVVDYEIDGGAGNSLSYGGRGALTFLDHSLELGASAVHEDQGVQQGDLYGLDADYRFGLATTLRAEVATSKVDTGSADTSGNAYLAELRHNGTDLAGRVYYREEGNGFGLGQQPGSENGTRKYGLDGSYRWTTDWSLNGEAFKERMLANGAERTVGQANANFQRPGVGYHFGLRQANDSQPGGDSNTSTQGLLGGFWQPGLGRWTLRGEHEQSLAGRNGSADYPTRTTLGSDFRLTDSTQVFAEQEFTSGEQRSNSTRAGLKTTPWRGGALSSAVGRQADGGSDRIFALLGLQQKLQLSKRWALDASLDRSQTVHSATPVNPNAPPASGDGSDYTAVTLGATYKLEAWSWWNRVEYRTSDSEDRWGVSSGLYGQLREDLGITTRLQAFLAESADGSRDDNADLRFGVVWRPLHSRWLLLDRLDLLADRQTSATSTLRGWRLVNNLNLNCRVGRRTQISLQYAAKYVLETIDGSEYRGYTDLVGFEGRYDLTERWDIGAYASMLHSWNGGQYQYRLGASVGCQVITNAWVSLGYNLLGFTDPDFSAAEYTAQGPYLRFRLKFDQASAADLRKLIDTF